MSEEHEYPGLSYHVAAAGAPRAGIDLFDALPVSIACAALLFRDDGAGELVEALNALQAAGWPLPELRAWAAELARYAAGRGRVGEAVSAGVAAWCNLSQ